MRKMKSIMIQMLVVVVMSFLLIEPISAEENQDITGFWRGSYEAGSGYRELTLAIHTVGNDGHVTATFNFSRRDDGTGESGSYTMDGYYNSENGNLVLDGAEWIDKPLGYSFKDLQGTIEDDTYSSSTFSLYKESTWDFSGLEGEWKGWYTNNSGLMDLDIYFEEITSSGYISSGRFIFNPSVGNDEGLVGSYKVHGFINPYNTQVSILGIEWIDHPESYVFMDLLGTIDGNHSQGVGSSSYSLSTSNYNYQINRVTESDNLIELDEAYKQLLTLDDSDESLSYVGMILEGISSEEVMYGETNSEVVEFIEYSISEYSAITLSSADDQVLITKDVIKESEKRAADFLSSINQKLEKMDLNLNREINIDLFIESSNSSDKVKIEFDESLKNTDVDSITYFEDDVTITLANEEIQSLLNENLIVNISRKDKDAISSTQVEDFNLVALNNSDGFLIANNEIDGDNYERYTIEFERDNQSVEQIEDKLIIGLESLSDDKDYDCVYIEKEGSTEQLGGFQNSNTGKTEILTDLSGTYMVKENRKYFHDITTLDADTKKAIAVLAAKGIINGKSENEFDPEGVISRAEFAKIIIKGLFLVDYEYPNNFVDVEYNAWYRPYVASSQKEGFVNGYSDGTYKPNNVISKQEMVKICAASLHEKTGYYYPESYENYLEKYSDEIPSWVVQYLALADREGIIVNAHSGLFEGSKGTTRADAAIMLYRLFKRL